MESPSSGQRFTLNRGVQIGPPERGIIAPTEYRIDLQREYEVYMHQAGSADLAGTCSIEAGPAGTYIVLPNFNVKFDPSDCEFRGAWETDRDGVARLQRVWLRVEGA
jgi:hypothetical protein